MFIPTQRPQNRYPMPPYANRPNYGVNPNRLYRNQHIPTPRGGTPSGGMGNLLGRLLGSGKAGAQAQAQVGNVASQGGGGLSKSLANIQQILNVVQSTAPMIQEYGPMVKNLPAMYRMMKAFKDLEKMSDDEVEKKEESTEMDFQPHDEEVKDIEISDEEEDKDEKIIEKKQVKTGTSIPKLYI